MNISSVGNSQTLFIPPELEKAKEQEAAAKEEKAEQLKKELEEKKQQEAELEMYKEQLEASKKQAEAVEEGFVVFGKCLRIAMRISSGDIVPQKDIEFLGEHEPEMLKQAILLRRPNAEPKEWESILDEEDMENTDESAEAPPETAGVTAENAPAPQVQAPAPQAEAEVSL